MGTSLNSRNNKYKIFYDGTSYLIFDKLVAKFSGCRDQQIEGKYKDYQNKFPNYVNELFKVFIDNQISIAFNFDEMMRKYKGLLKFDYLSTTFINCQHIIDFTPDFKHKLLE